jgi:hypothetical protein
MAAAQSRAFRQPGYRHLEQANRWGKCGKNQQREEQRAYDSAPGIWAKATGSTWNTFGPCAGFNP